MYIAKLVVPIVQGVDSRVSTSNAVTVKSNVELSDALLPGSTEKLPDGLPVKSICKYSSSPIE